MKLALLVAVSEDKRTGQVISPELLPYDEAVKLFKQKVTDGVPPSAELPNLELWVASAGRVKSHRCNPARARSAALASPAGKGRKKQAAPVEAPPPPPPGDAPVG